jgi:hypothetical protein
VWDVKGEPKEQENLVISRPDRPDEPEFMVDKLEIAHFIYMIRHDKKLREVIRESTAKVVLILGRFTKKRYSVLKAVQKELQAYTDEEGKGKYIPVMFDFDPESRDLMETVQILVGLSRFVIADVTSPKGVLVELATIVPHWEIPVKLIIDNSSSQKQVRMLDPLTKYKWIDNKIFPYNDSRQLCQALKKQVIDPIEDMAQQLQATKASRFVCGELE